MKIRISKLASDITLNVTEIAEGRSNFRNRVDKDYGHTNNDVIIPTIRMHFRNKK